MSELHKQAKLKTFI